MSTARSRPSTSTTGVIRVMTFSRMDLMKTLSSTARRYASSMSAVGAAVSGEWMVPVSTINIPKDQFAPRLGVAWQLTPKTVLRTGYGIFYAKTTNSTYYATRVENGVYQQTSNCTPKTCPALAFPNVIWTPPGPTMAAPF